MNIVYLLLGSNLGERHFFLQQAISHIATHVGRIVQQSGIYETQAWGNTATPDYLNQVLKVRTQLEPLKVLDAILAIEQSHGRQREEKWGARTLDIDMLFYNNEVIDIPRLIIPHPFLHQRRFTLEPMAEISPELIHPVLGKNILTLKDELNDGLIVKKL